MRTIDIKRVKTAKTLWGKTIGVIGWKDFDNNNGLLLTDTNSIHTFFVRFSLDLVFLDENMVIIKLTKDLKPFRISQIVWRAKHVLEMPTGSIEKYELAEKDKVVLI
jgi:hypothetical protein